MSGIASGIASHVTDPSVSPVAVFFFLIPAVEQAATGYPVLSPIYIPSLSRNPIAKWDSVLTDPKLPSYVIPRSVRARAVARAMPGSFKQSVNRCFISRVNLEFS